MKTIEDYFADWESSAFGYGYGTGEGWILPELKKFMWFVGRDPHPHAYDYEVFEEKLGGPIAWLLINALCKADAIEYGTSPRYGWLTENGVRLKAFIDGKTEDSLVDLCTTHTEEYTPCYPDVCNCGLRYVEGPVCPNPFWSRRKAVLATA